MNKIELLAPAGNMEKFKTAIHFGADAVYLSGKQFGLRAFADNFTEEEIAEADEIIKNKILGLKREHAEYLAQKKAKKAKRK